MVAEAPSYEELVSKLSEYEGKVREAEAKLAEVRSDTSAGIDALLAAAKEVEAMKGVLERGQKAVEKAAIDARKDERDAAVEAVREMLRGSEDIDLAFECGITQFIVTKGDEGGILIDAKVKSTGATRGGGGGGSRGTISWEYNGTSYTSRQLLEQYGDDNFEAGWTEKVMERAAAGAGFNQPVRSLAKKLGARGVRPDGSEVELD